VNPQPLKYIEGRWRGEYAYDPSDIIPTRPSVGFSLCLKRGWFGRFTGTVTDDPPNGVPGTGLIEGSFAFPRIRFIKRMPIAYTALPDGRKLTLRESIIEKGYPCERDYPAPQILYRGLFSDGRRAEGTWILNPLFIRLPDGRALRTTGATGTWNIALDGT
jgi:hypothetical protein